jgi:ribosome-associated protein YbcJ (S4-like RNA binding protein)
MRPETEVAKIIITSEDKQVREVELVKERVTIGRKPHNDIALDHRAVSSQHATLTVMLDDAILEDLGSTNGTFINGQKVYRQKLADGDKVSIATFELQFVASPMKPQPTGRIEVINGAHAGKRLALNKPLTTIGKPGTAVVAITYAAGTYMAAGIEGEGAPVLNGTPITGQSQRLTDGDVLDLSGTRMTFLAR